MGVTKRRMEILKILSKRRYETAENLAAEFNVSIKTIRKDIIDLLVDTKNVSEIEST